MQDARLDLVAARWIDKTVSPCTIPRRISPIEQYAGMNSLKEQLIGVKDNGE